jgi:hypothetical protein
MTNRHISAANGTLEYAPPRIDPITKPDDAGDARKVIAHTVRVVPWTANEGYFGPATPEEYADAILASLTAAGYSMRRAAPAAERDRGKFADAFPEDQFDYVPMRSSEGIMGMGYRKKDLPAAESGMVLVPSHVTECPACGRWHDDVVCPYCGTEFDGRAR